MPTYEENIKVHQNNIVDMTCGSRKLYDAVYYQVKAGNPWSADLGIDGEGFANIKFSIVVTEEAIDKHAGQWTSTPEDKQKEIERLTNAAKHTLFARLR
jgi:hypothetical protein